MSLNKRGKLILLPLIALVIGSAMSCNKKSEEEPTEIVVTSSTVAVRKFTLKADSEVLAHLDSVFFSIDLNTGVIFNADSLPKGTDVTKLVPNITFANTMTKAEIRFTNSDNEQTTVDYLADPAQSVDFSAPVSLSVVAADGNNSFTYQIKVNVHKEDPDAMNWTQMESTLPSRYGNPVSQKSLVKDETVYCLIEEYNGTYTLATSTDINNGIWQKNEFNPGFEPDTKSFCAGDENFYLLSVTGQLYTSADCNSWSNTNQSWNSILGGYGNSVLGLKYSGNSYVYTQYPQAPGFVETAIEEGFPVEGFSALGLIETKWADKPMAILTGGVTDTGVLSPNVWAYDGTRWAVINDKALPALYSPFLIRYVVFRETNAAFAKREFDVWMLFGGIDESDVMNRAAYISYDNGVSWLLTAEDMWMTPFIPALRGADAVVAGEYLSSDLADSWLPSEEETKSRTSYIIDGYEITWRCPYIYLMGGYSVFGNNSLNRNIYRGVLQRLTFTPSI